MRIWRCLDFGWCKHVSPGWTIVRAKKVCCRLSGELHRFDGEAGGPEGGDEKKNLDDEDSSLPPKKYHLPNRHFPPAPSSKFNFKRISSLLVWYSIPGITIKVFKTPHQSPVPALVRSPTIQERSPTIQERSPTVRLAETGVVSAGVDRCRQVSSFVSPPEDEKPGPKKACFVKSPPGDPNSVPTPTPQQSIACFPYLLYLLCGHVCRYGTTYRSCLHGRS